jgi:hypothetical protein
MRIRLALLAGSLALLLAAFVSAAGADGRYADTTGDGNGAPDIQGVNVTSDASGQVTFRISVDSLPASPADAHELVWIDSDLNEATGAPDTLGADYAFLVDQTDNTFDFAHWNGSTWDDSIPFSTVSVFTNSTSLTVSVNRSELGGSGGFNFWVKSVLGDPSANQSDDAPDVGTWSYSLAAEGPDIQGVVTLTKPTAGPRRGKPFTISPVGLRVPNNLGGVSVLAHPDSYRCSAKLAGKALRGRGTGKCTWTIPKKKARGRSLVVVMTVSYEGASKSFRFVYRVR